MKHMLCLLLVSQALALNLRHKFTLKVKADPFCKTGIVDTTMHACCPKDCGSCDDKGDACQGGKLACCPSAVTANQDDILEKRPCDDTNPPCVLGEKYREPPAADALDVLANTKIHAKDDCNKVIPATQHQLHVSLHYAEKKDVATSGQCIGTEEYETVEEAARACTKDEECSGFKAPPGCIFMSGLTYDEPGTSIYLKVLNQAGHAVKTGQSQFSGPSDKSAAQMAAEAAEKKAAEDAKRAEEEAAAAKKLAEENQKKEEEADEELKKAEEEQGKAAEELKTAETAVHDQEKMCEEEKKGVELGGENDGKATGLEACIGECDNDGQCKEGLICFQRTGLNPVPGCSGEGKKDWDYCYDPTGSVELSGGNDDKAKNLEACTGECDNDEQCKPGLKCFQRSNGETIPGCKGSGGGKDWDYCYDPDWAPLKELAPDSPCDVKLRELKVEMDAKVRAVTATDTKVMKAQALEKESDAAHDGTKAAVTAAEEAITVATEAAADASAAAEAAEAASSPEEAVAASEDAGKALEEAETAANTAAEAAYVKQLVPTGVYALWCPHHGRYVRMNADGNMDWSDPKGKDEFPSDWTWEVFTAVDGGNGEIALWSEYFGKYMRMRDDGNMDVSDPKGKDELPPPNEWTWERFKEVDATGGQVALYCPHHGKFVRMNSNGNMDASDPKGEFDLPPPNEWTWERFEVVELKAPYTPYMPQLQIGGTYALHSGVHNRFIRMNGNGNMDWSDPRGKNELPGDWTWERFKIVDGQDGSIALWCPIHGRYVRMRDNCDMDWSDPKGEHELPPPNEWTWERFKEVDGGFGQIALWSPHHGKFVRMNGNGNMDCSDSKGEHELPPPKDWTWERFSVVQG